MKFQKLVLAGAALMAVSALAGCAKKPADQEVDVDYELAQPGQLAEGFTSLANEHANAPLKDDGTYVAGGHTFKIKDTLRTTYAAEPNRAFFNYLTNQWTINSYHYCNMVSGLVENDKYSNVVGDLALGYKVTENADGTESWQFQLRENAEWVNNKTGKFYGKVEAQDFVDAVKYVLDPNNASGTVNILYVIKGAAAYNITYSDYLKFNDPKIEEEAKNKLIAKYGENGPTIPSFDTVGIKKVSEFVVEYTLEEPTPYFLSMLTYSPFLPVKQAYIDERGSDFGKTCNDILVNGAFRITTHEFETKMMYTKNYHYFDRDHVYVKHVLRTYVPGTATSSTTREWYESGVVDSFTVNATDEEGWNKYVKGGENGTGTLVNPAHENCTSTQSFGDAVYIGYWNFNRGNDSYEFGQGSKLMDGTTAFTSKTDAQKLAAAKAIFNKQFRQGFMYGMKALEYLKRFSKDEPYNYLMRSYTNRELVFYEGKDYCEFVDDVYNEKNPSTERKSLTGIIAGEDVVFDADKAALLFAAAKVELIAGGMTEADFPVYIDVIQSQSASLQPLEKAMYQAIETASNGVLKIVLNLPDNDAQDEKWGSETNNYDFSIWSGWGPDYADPKTYMHTFAKDGGDSLVYLGFEEDEVSPIYKQASGKNTIDELKDYVLGDYDALYQKAAAITDTTKTGERFRAFAEAEYDLIFDSAIIAPWMSQSGYFATVANTVAWQAGRATYGLTGDKFKNVVVSDEVITKALKAALTAEYEAGKVAA